MQDRKNKVEAVRNILSLQQCELSSLTVYTVIISEVPALTMIKVVSYAELDNLAKKPL